MHFQRISIYLEAVHGNLCPERLGQNQNVTDITLVRSKKYSKCSYFLGPSMLALLIVPKFCVLSFYLDSYRHLRGFFQPFIDVKLIFPKYAPRLDIGRLTQGHHPKTYMMYSFEAQTAVATPPIMHQGLSTVSPPVTRVPALRATSW